MRVHSTSAPRPVTACGSEESLRHLQIIAQRIAVIDGAVSAGLASLKGKMDRIGIPSMYGCANETTGDEPAGELEQILQALDVVDSRARELRGLAETIDERL